MQKKIFQAKSATSIIVARVRSTYLDRQCLGHKRAINSCEQCHTPSLGI